MKTKLCICFSTMLSVMLLFTNVTFGIGGTGGGSVELTTDTASPYSGMESINKELIVKTKEYSNKQRIIKGSDLPNYKTVIDRCHSIGLSYEYGERIQFYFYGYAPNLKTVLKIPFGEIDSIEIKEILNEYDLIARAIVKISIFPAISIEELLSEKPNYISLKERFSKDILLSIKISDPKKGKLLLVCNEDDYSQFTSIDSFMNLPKDKKIPFTFEIRRDAPVWWALEEVVNDDSYPLKITKPSYIMGID